MSEAVPLEGVLVIDKPSGMTSRQVVAEVSRRLGVDKAGHAGTLDPMATGVLVVCIGRATRIAGVLTADDKVYLGELELGAETDTLDAEGQLVAEDRQGAARVTREQLAEAMAPFRGASQQLPPMYSAVRVGGQRLHTLARKGLDVERPVRPIRIERFELETFDSPRAGFVVECSKGTYVRTLVSDLGKTLKCGAHLTALRRVRSGQFTIDQAIALDDLDQDQAQARRVPALKALSHLCSVQLTELLVARVVDGKPMKWNEISEIMAPEGLIALVTEQGGLMALGQVRGERFHYQRVFPNPLT